MPNDAPIAYIDRTRAYYLALGYDDPYRWAQYDTSPFTPLRKPLSDCRVAIITTAAPFQPGKGDQGPGAPYNAAAKFYAVYEGATDHMPDLRISHVAIDRDHTTAEDIGSYFPLAALRRAQKAGRVGQVAPKFFGLPTNRSQKTTLEIDAPELLRRCQRDGVDAAIFVPNCPVCHQSVALAARALEQAGIATVIMGCTRDIVQRAHPPRFLFSDFPLGNGAGRPNDVDSQDVTLSLALEMLKTATQAGEIRQSPLKWHGAADWKNDYSNAAALSVEELARRRAVFDQGRKTAKAIRKGD